MINSYKDKLERGVSPVVGVILMVAVTVILAAVIGSFVLNLGGSVSQPAQAGVTFDADGTSVDVQLNSVQAADSITVESSNGATITNGVGTDSDQLLLEDGSGGPGTIVSVTGLTDGETISVIGKYEGESTVIQTYTYEA